MMKEECMTTGPGNLALVERTGLEDVAWVHVARFSGDPEGRLVEFVDGTADGKGRHDKWIINISTQFGCPVGCAFCDAGATYRGDLSAEQMLAQVRWVLGCRPGLAERCGKLKVHFSRMGEPALNDSVLTALEGLRGLVQSRELWACVATTAPRVSQQWFVSLFEIAHREFPGRFQLQLSVNSTQEETRRRLMPIPLLTLEELAELARGFYRPGERKAVLNFALAKGVDFDVERVARVFSPDLCAVKLTPVNPTVTGASKGFQTLLRSCQEEAAFLAAGRLEGMGFDVIVSIGEEEEDTVGSNCGQSVVRLGSGAA